MSSVHSRLSLYSSSPNRFDHFYIYDNSDNFLLRQWGEEKGCHVRVIHYPGEAQQQTAYHHCSVLALQEQHTWAAMFDVDEILILKQHHDIHPFLEEYCPNGALGINWLVFGTADRLVYSPQPFTKRFQFRKRKPDPWVKSITRLKDIDLSKGKIRIHYPPLLPGFSQHDTNGRNFTGPTNAVALIDVAISHHYRYKLHQKFVRNSLKSIADFSRGSPRVQQQIVEDAKPGQVPYRQRNGTILPGVPK